MKTYLRTLPTLLTCLFLCLTPGLFAQKNFSGVWHQTSLPYKVWSNANWASFKAKWDELNREGFRLVDIETSVSGGERKFFGVWQQGGGNHRLWVGANWVDFKNKWDEARAEGLNLIDLEIYFSGGRKFIGVWREGTVPEELTFNESWEGFKRRWDELNKANYRLIDFEVYLEDGALKYAGIWQKGQNNDLLLTDLTSDQFNTLNQKLNENKMRLIDLEVHPNLTRQKRFSGLWYREEGGQAIVAETNWGSFLGKIREWPGERYTLIDLETNSGAADFFDPNQTGGGANIAAGGTPTPARSSSGSGSSSGKSSEDDELPPVYLPPSGNNTNTNPGAAASGSQVETGKASYYADKFQGSKTASGELYDKNKLTAAHRTHPFGTLCRVTNLANNRSVIVRVNDRGPHVPSRVIDVSRAAAEQLDGIRMGIFSVKVEVVSQEEYEKQQGQ